MLSSIISVGSATRKTIDTPPVSPISPLNMKSPPISASKLRYDAYDAPRLTKSLNGSRSRYRDDTSISPSRIRNEASLGAGDFALLTLEADRKTFNKKEQVREASFCVMIADSAVDREDT